MLIEADCPFQCIRVAKVRRAFPRKVLSSNIRYFAFWVKYRQCHRQSGTIVRRGGISSQMCVYWARSALFHGIYCTLNGIRFAT